MNSINCKDLVKKINLPMIVVHSMKNCIINISHVYHFKSMIKEKHNNNINILDNNKPENIINNRKILYLEGGHDIIEVKLSFIIFNL